MRALKVVLAACAAAVVLGVLAIPGQAQQSTRRPPMIRVYSTSGADVINTSTYVEPQINLSENAYVFAVEMDLDGQIQVLHPDFPGLSVKISAHTQLRLPNFFAGFNQAVPEAGVYTSARFQRYSPYGGYQDTRGTVLALASRAPFNLDPISSGDDWNITALRRLMENRTPLEAINLLANYLGAKGEPIGRDFMRFAGGATNRYAYADYAYYSPCDFYYGSFYGALGFAQFRALNQLNNSRRGQPGKIVGFDVCGVPIVSFGPVGTSRFPIVRIPRPSGDTTVFPKGRFPVEKMPSHPRQAAANSAPEGVFPLPHRVGQMGDVTISAPAARRGEPRIIDGYRPQPSTLSMPEGRMPIDRAVPHTEPAAASGAQPVREYHPEPRVVSPPPRAADPAPPVVVHERPSTPPPPPPRTETPAKTPPARQ